MRRLSYVSTSMALVVKEPLSHALKADVERAVDWIVRVGLECSRRAAVHSEAMDVLLDKVEVCVACSSLPGDAPLRVRLTPNVFNLRA